MKSVLDQLHAKFGDIWWYSLMLFCASRAADVLNVFVGLYLVPKYIGSEELGAVMPLTSFASCLALPIGVFSTVFMKEVNTLAVRGEYGKLKTLLRSVFVVAAIFLALAILVSHFVLPYFLERIRVGRGSLGVLILASSFVGATAPIYVNVLQAMKKFRTLSVINVLGAPIRLIAMLIAMPFRPLSGYFVGQAASPAFSIVATVAALRKELAVKAEPYWSSATVRHLSCFVLFVLLHQGTLGIAALVEQTILRQRLPDIQSAAYYLTTRYSDIANFLVFTFLAILFPYTAELAEKGRSTRRCLLKAVLVVVGFNGFLAAAFLFGGDFAMCILPDGKDFVGYSWAIPFNVVVNTIVAFSSLHISTEISAGRFRFLWWWVPVCVVYLVALYGCVDAVDSLATIMWWFFGFAVIRAVFSVIDLVKQR